jgi:hypothetical protein
MGAAEGAEAGAEGEAPPLATVAVGSGTAGTVCEDVVAFAPSSCRAAFFATVLEVAVTPAITPAAVAATAAVATVMLRIRREAASRRSIALRLSTGSSIARSRCSPAMRNR